MTETTTSQNKEALKEIVGIFRDDVQKFANTLFEITLRPKQIEIAETFRDKQLTTVKGGIGLGKTLTLAVLTWWSLITKNDVVVTIYGPSEDQLKKGIWKEIKRLHGIMHPAFAAMFDVNETSVKRKSRSAECFAEYKLANPENPASSRGVHAPNNYVIVDEATGIDDVIYDEAIMNVYSDSGAKIILVSNPTTVSGYYWRTFNDPSLSHLWTPITATAWDSGDFTDQKHQFYIAQYGGQNTNKYKNLILGEFSETTTDGLIPRHIVDMAVDNEDVIINPANPYIWGLDAATDSVGSDDSVLVIRNDNYVTEIVNMPGLNGTALVNKVAELYQRTPVNQRPIAICVDTAGYGKAIADFLKDLGLPIKEVHVSKSPTRNRDRYGILRDQLWWETREWFFTENVRIPNNSDLIKQLTVVSYDTSGKFIKIEKKKDIRKKLSGDSPDIADALALTFAASTTAMMGKYNVKKILNYNYSAYE